MEQRHDYFKRMIRKTNGEDHRHALTERVSNEVDPELLYAVRSTSNIEHPDSMTLNDVPMARSVGCGRGKAAADRREARLDRSGSRRQTN